MPKAKRASGSVTAVPQTPTKVGHSYHSVHRHHVASLIEGICGPRNLCIVQTLALDQQSLLWSILQLLHGLLNCSLPQAVDIHTSSSSANSPFKNTLRSEHKSMPLLPLLQLQGQQTQAYPCQQCPSVWAIEPFQHALHNNVSPSSSLKYCSALTPC
jgi:hypothetical protein